MYTAEVSASDQDEKNTPKSTAFDEDDRLHVLCLMKENEMLLI